MDALIKAVEDAPQTVALFTIIIGAVFGFAGKWWGAYFTFKSKTTDTPSSVAEAAVRIQSAVLADIRADLEKAESRFKDAMAAQKKTFDGRIDRMREVETRQQEDLSRLRERLAGYEERDEQYRKDIDEWKKRYWKLDKEHAEVKAKLSVYEKKTVK